MFQVSDPHQQSSPNALSPMGSALIGRAPGAIARVALPRGRARTLTILDVAERPRAG